MIILVGIITFISEYLDSGLGMGYGTALAPILILFGYEPLKVVPAILISQLVTDVVACFSHHGCGNVDLNFKSKDFKVALFLGFISAVGVIVSVVLALKIPKWILTLYIGLLVVCMGILILVTIQRPMQFSWKKIMGFSFLAAFNKGISGGGYGPLVMGGQMLSGVCPKNAVGITAFAEAVTCLVGFIAYLLLGKQIDWKLTILLILCATPAVPFAAFTAKKIDADKLRFYVGIFITILGVLTLTRISGGG
jgi:uncharacterized membrane protein YfcA